MQPLRVPAAVAPALPLHICRHKCALLNAGMQYARLKVCGVHVHIATHYFAAVNPRNIRTFFFLRAAKATFSCTPCTQQFPCMCAQRPPEAIYQCFAATLLLVFAAQQTSRTLHAQAELGCWAAESPQWRKGPASKPVLCNACGTRYRRTSQLSIGRPVLGPACPGQARKRCAEQARPRLEEGQVLVRSLQSQAVTTHASAVRSQRGAGVK